MLLLLRFSLFPRAKLHRFFIPCMWWIRVAALAFPDADVLVRDSAPVTPASKKLRRYRYAKLLNRAIFLLRETIPLVAGFGNASGLCKQEFKRLWLSWLKKTLREEVELATNTFKGRVLQLNKTTQSLALSHHLPQMESAVNFDCNNFGFLDSDATNISCNIP